MDDAERGMNGRIDWAALVDELKKRPGEEVLAGEDLLGSTRAYVKARYGLEARMEGQDRATTRGKLYVRWPAEGAE